MSPSLVLTVRVRTWFLLSICLFLVAAALMWASRQKAANIITVNSTLDVANPTDGLCTLREAIAAANNNANSGAVAGECAAGDSSGSDAINLSVTGTINLTGALPDLATNLSISGPGSSQLTVRRDTGGFYRILTITSGTVVSISGLTLNNGQTLINTPTPTIADGGGILNGGTLSLVDVAVTANKTGVGSQGNGGGINNNGTLTMSNCLVSGNSTGNGLNSGSGGGISSSGSLIMTNSIVTANITGDVSSGGEPGSGGGIFNSGSLNLTKVELSSNTTGSQAVSDINGGVGGGIGSNQGTLTNCTIKDNQTPTALGGGVSGNNMAVIGSTVSGNRPAGIVVNGGGVKSGGVNGSGVLVVINTTLSGNQGYGIHAEFGRFALVNSTVVSNSGVGMSMSNFNSASTVRNTLVALNQSETTGNIQSQGHNFLGALQVGSGYVDGPGDILGFNTSPIDPHIGPLANNGGPVQTHALLSNSPALDAGDNCVTDPSHCGDSFTPQITIDQRGAPRQVDGELNGVATVDIGAYELQNFEVINTNDSGAGSLRQAITGASAAPNSPTIWINIPASDPGCSGGVCTITLTTGVLVINHSMTIQGPGANLFTISGNNNGRVFDIQSGTVAISAVTIANGNFTFSPGGAGIANAGTLTLTKSRLTGNHTTSFGAAISNNGGTATLTECLIDTNEGNQGGGIAVRAGTVTVYNSTVSDNLAQFRGGGFYSEGGTLTLINVTIANNRAIGLAGGGGVRQEAPGVVTLHNSMVAGNLGGGPSLGPQDIIGTTDASSSFNVISSDSSGSMANGFNNNQVNVANPGLGPLANNGGPTRTHALLPNSPALDAGSNTIATNAGLTTDQRGTGFGRFVDGPDADATATVDVGAFEAQVSVADITDKTGNEDTQVQFSFSVSGSISSVTATSSNTALVPNSGSNIAVSGSGSSRTLTINPLANESGASTITVTVNSSNGENATDTFLLTVNPVNDAPSFTKGANQTVNEDAGAQTVNNWATAISAGPNESGQTVTFTVTNNNNGLFSSQPAVNSAGTLSYTPAANANGSATVTVTAKDDGGTVNGGNDTSAPQTFTITVNAVNDPPSFTKGADQTVSNTAGAQTVAGWATSISRGPSDESGQTLTFTVTNNANALFSTQPAISSTGTLTYTPSSSAGGTATITVSLKDNGGTANGGVDTSSQTFTITVTPVGGFVNFASATANTTENSGSTSINVVRTGDTSKAVTVNYAGNADAGVPCSTANGVASPKCDFTAALGTLNFAAGETSKPITILISQDSFVEGPENITLTLSSPTANAALGTQSTMSVAIADDASEPPTNIIDDPNMFVRMHYHDFLNREADQSGLDFWTGQMTNCGSPDLLVCRVNVSGAFFLSIEFQQTGYLVERMYKAGYGDATATSQIGGSHQIFVPVVRANEFLADTQRIGRGVVVLAPGWEQALENNKQAYALEFVQTSRFVTAYPTTMTSAAFVNALNQNAGNVLSPAEFNTALSAFGPPPQGGSSNNVNARAQVLRQIAEDQDLYNAEFNRAFVLTEYFGYLRRNPNDAPESTLDYTGYDFWLGKLNQFNGNYIAAEMVKAFIASDEYRKRFGP